MLIMYCENEWEEEGSPLGSRVVTLHSVSAGLALQVATDGKQEALQDSHAHTTSPVSHQRNDVHHPAISLRIVTLHIAKRLVLRHTT